MSEVKFKRSMLDYSKIILSKMSFDKKLFRKEYKKTFRYLDHGERVSLKNWIRSQWSMSQSSEMRDFKFSYHDEQQE